MNFGGCDKLCINTDQVKIDCAFYLHSVCVYKLSIYSVRGYFHSLACLTSTLCVGVSPTEQMSYTAQSIAVH